MTGRGTSGKEGGVWKKESRDWQEYEKFGKPGRWGNGYVK